MTSYSLVIRWVAKYISYSLISWVIHLSGQFVASYPLVDSLGGKVYLLIFYLLGGFTEWRVRGFLSISGFLRWQSISFILLSIGWIPLSGEFVVYYPLVDYLGGKVPILLQPQLILSSYP